MKLHLPTRLRAAVLACITAVAALATTVGTGALTTGVVAYTIVASQAEATAKVNRTFEYGGVTYSGGELVTIDVTNSANVTAGGAGHALSGVANITATLDIDGTPTDKKFNEGVHALNGTGGTDASRDYTLWTSFSDVSGVGTYYGQTLRLAGASEAWSVTFDFNGMAFGGLVTEAAAEGGAYTLGRPQAGNAIHLVAANVAGAGVNMSIGADTTLVGGSVTVMSSGTWALSKSLTMGAATTLNANQAVTLTGAGALNISGALTLNAGSRIAAADNAIAVNGALSLNLDGMTTDSEALISSAGAVSATGLTLNNYLTLAAGDYKLVSTTNEAATTLAGLFESTDQFAVTNKNGVVTLTVQNTGMETLTEDLVGVPNNNFHKVCVNGLDVGEHTITATYGAAGYSTVYTKDLKGSGNITFNRTNGGNNLCVLWIDGDATEYTGTIAMGNLSNAYLKLGSANGATDLSNATVNMTKEVIALGNNATIGTLTANQTEIRAVDGTVENIANMSTGMQASTAGFAQAGGVIRKLTITTSGELTSTTLNSGVTLAIAQGASVTLAGGTMNGLISNSGALNLSGALTLNGPIMMGADSSATFANDVQLDLSRLTADEGVYHILDGAGTSNLGSLTTSNVTGIDLTGKTLAFDNSGTITLIDNTSDLIWKGGAGTWDETSQNWTKGGDPAIFADADRVTFNDESDVTLVGDLIAGGVNVNAAVTLEGAGSLEAREIIIAETGSLTINGDASVSVDREKLNKMQVSGSGTLEINKIGTDALAFDGGDAGFSGTLALTQDVAPSGHSFTTTLTNFTGTVVIDALINHAASDFGDASKLVFVGSRDTNQIGFWCNTGINPTLEQDIEIAGDNEVRFFLNGTTLNGDITGNKLRLHSGTGTFGGQVELNRLNMAQDGVTLNLKGDTTLGALVHDGNNTRLNVGDAEHQVTLNITGTDHRVHNAKSHTYNVAAGSVVNDNSYIELTNSTLTVTGGGTYNLKGICSSADGNYVGNVVVDTNTTLHITGTVLSAEGKQGSFMLSNWPAGGTYTVRGALISEAGISGRDGVGVINVENGGLLRLNAGIVGVTAWAGRWGRANINVKEGATLQTASTPSQNNDLTVSLAHGSTLEGVDADGDTTIAQNLTISGSAETPATANIKVGEAQSLTISSVISGEHGALNKTGEGTLVLSGTNTYAGGTTVTAGTLDAVGTLGAGNVTVGTGATIILHNTVDGSVFANNGTIEIASGFAGLESAGTVGVAGATEGNGYTMGGSANLFTTSGTLTGTREATFNGANVTIAEDGSFELDTDWSTYRVKSARSETETIAAIKALATEHSASLKNLVFSDGVDAAMETMDVDGFNVELGNTAHTIGTLNITNGTVTSSCAGADGVAFTSGTVNINEGGKLVLTGSDAFSWCSSPADSPVILLAGAEGNTAVLQLDQRMSYGKGEGENGSVISLNGYSHVTGEGGLDPVGDMNNPATVNVAAGTTNNVFDATVYKRSVLVFNVGEGAELTIGSTFTDSPSGNTNVGHVTKAGAGTATITKDNTFYGLNLKAGTLVIDGADVLVTKTGASGSNGSEFNLWEQGTATGVLKLVNEANLKVDTNSNMWFHDGTSVLIEKESSFTKLATNYTMEIKAAGETDGKMIAKQGASWYYGDLSSDIFYVEDAAVSISSTADANVGLKMNGASTFTNTGATTLTLTNAATTALSAVNAQGGNIALGSVASVGTMAITAGKTVSSANDLSISTALTAGAGSTLSAALTLSNGAALDLVTGSGALNIGDHAVTLGTGLTITEAMMTAITSLQAETSLTLMKGVTSLTGGALDATTVFTGLTGDYQITVEDGNLVVSAMALPAADLTWEGSDGIWGEGTPWTKEGGASAYEEGANVTIGGEGAPGGTITVSGAQKAKNMTFASGSSASDKYVVNAASGASLDITGNLIVNEGVSAAMGFLPSLGESSSIIVNSGAELDLTTAGSSADLMKTVFTKGSGEGTIKIQGAGTTADNVTLQTNIAVSGDIWLGGSANSQRIVEVGDDSSLTVSGKLTLASSAEVTVAGGSLQVDGGIYLGHETAEKSYKGVLNMSDGDIQTSFIHFNREDTVNKVNITGGTLTITGESAFTGTGTASTVNVGAATIKNGETDMAFNHASVLTGTTISAQNDKTITVGGTGMTTTLAGAITTEGKVTLDGTLVTTGLTALNNSGALSITGDTVELKGSVLNNTGTLATTGALTLTDAATVGGTVNAGSLSLTGANTFTAVTTGALTIADSLNVTGALTATSVTISNVSLTTTALTAGSFVGDSLALTVDENAIATAMGASATTLTLANITGLTAATINGDSSFTVGSREYTIGVEGGIVTITSAISDQVIWKGSEGDVWGDGDSWETGTQPDASSNVVFNGDGVADVIVGSGAQAGAIFVETDTNFIPQTTGNVATGGVEISAGTLTIDEDVTVVATGTTSVVNETGNLIIKGALQTDTLAATGKDVQLSGTLTVDTKGSVNSIGGIGSDYGKLIVGTDAELTLLDVVEEKLTIATDSTVGDLEVKHTGNLDAKGTFTVNNKADVAAGGVMTVAKNLTVSDDLTNAGNITVGSAAAPATLSTEDVTNNGTITVYNTMTSTGNVSNKADATLDVKGNLTANTAGKTVTNDGTLTVGGTANVTALTTTNGSSTTVKGNTTIAGALNNGGTLTVGTQAAPATLATGDVVNNGSITVYNTMTSTGDVTNNAGKTLDVKGNLTANTEGKTVTNEGTMTIGGTADVATLTTGDAATTGITGNATVATALTNEGSTTIGGALTATNATVTNEATGAGEKLTVTGALTADTLTTAAGATTEAKGGATLGTSLDNHGTTTVTGDLASADATAPITITNDAAGAGEKLVVTGNVTAKSLTTETGATTELTGSGKKIKLTDSLTNKGTTTIKGDLVSADATATTPGSLLVSNTGTLSTGNLKANSLSGGGATTVKGNATVTKLDLGTTGSLTATGTVKTNNVSSTGGSLTADTLDLSGLTDAATFANIKADKITLSGFNMLKVTDSISNETGTDKAKVSLTLDAATMGTLSVGDQLVVVATDGAVSGKGITLDNIASVNSALKAYGIKGTMLTNAAGELVMMVEDNSFRAQIATSENGKAGAAMLDEASAAGYAAEGTALGDIYAALDACRDSGNTAEGDRIASALTGSSIAAMGSALSGDVERQLRAIRNRTTTMGVNQGVINEGLPYFNAWVNAEGDYRKVAADGTMAGYKMTSWGGTVGMDVDVTPRFTCGLAATAMYGDFDADSSESASGDIDTYYVSAFARYAKHRWTHTFVATVGLAETSLERTIQGHTVKGDSDGMMFGGMYEVGYVFALDKNATTCLQPVLNVSYTHATLNGYTESGANMALTAGDTEFNKLTVGAGARLQSVVGENIYNRSSILEARALVKFDAGDRQGETDVAFAGFGSVHRTTKSSETGAIGAEIGVGLTVPVGSEGGSIFADASAEIRAEYTNVNATVGYRVNF